MLRMSIDERSNMNETNGRTGWKAACLESFLGLRCTYVPSKLHDREEVANAVPKTCHVNDLNQDKVCSRTRHATVRASALQNWIRSHRCGGIMVGTAQVGCQAAPKHPIATARSFLPFPYFFLAFADHTSLVIICFSSPPISRQSKPQVVDAVSRL